MKKKIITSSLLLLVGGLITKLLGMIIKIFMSRILGIEGLSLYMLILPTFSFCILLGQAGFPFTLSRMVAYKEKNVSSLYATSFLFLLFYNILMSIILILLAPTISETLLKNEAAYLPVIAIAIVIPFTTLSSILRSYFVGIQKLFPSVLSNIIENLLRLLFVLGILPKIDTYSLSFQVFLIVLFNCVSEGISSIILISFLPKKKKTYTLQPSYLKETIETSYPQLLSTLIGNGTYFLEPILLFHLITKEFSIETTTQQYGIITGYVLPLILLPSFFVTAISQVLLPTMTEYYKEKNYKKIKKILKVETLFMFILSSFMTLFLNLFAKESLYLVYHTTYGIKELKLISFFVFFLYLEPIFQYTWIAFGKTKEVMLCTIFSSIVRILSLTLLLQKHFGTFSLLLSLIFNLVSTTIFEYIRIKKHIKKEDYSSI